MINRPRVLIIHEDRRTVDKLQELFVRSGYEAEIALTSEVGLSVIRERHMSVAVLGSELGPDGNWEFIKKLKESDPGLPVVLFNAPKVKGLSREARRVGVQKLLAIPTDVEAVQKEAVKVMRN